MSINPRQITWIRYNQFVEKATDELKIGGDIKKAKIWAMLAQAEAMACVSEEIT